MELYSRPLMIEDYENLVDWGEFWRFPLPPINFLPKEGNLFSGIMICDEKLNNCCAGFIYETNSDVCWMEYIISNPKVKDKNKRNVSLSTLINNLSEYAGNKGFQYIFTTVKNNNLINRYLDGGFVVGTKGSTEMIKIL